MTGSHSQLLERLQWHDALRISAAWSLLTSAGTCTVFVPDLCSICSVLTDMMLALVVQSTHQSAPTCCFGAVCHQHRGSICRLHHMRTAMTTGSGPFDHFDHPTSPTCSCGAVCHEHWGSISRLHHMHSDAAGGVLPWLEGIHGLAAAQQLPLLAAAAAV